MDVSPIFVCNEHMQTRARITPNALVRRPGTYPSISLDKLNDINTASQTRTLVNTTNFSSHNVDI